MAQDTAIDFAALAAPPGFTADTAHDEAVVRLFKVLQTKRYALLALPESMHCCMAACLQALPAVLQLGAVERQSTRFGAARQYVVGSKTVLELQAGGQQCPEYGARLQCRWGILCMQASKVHA